MNLLDIGIRIELVRFLPLSGNEAAMKTRITDRYLKTMTLPANGRMRMDYDTELRGFAVRVTATGSRTFVLTYMFRGAERRMTIGRFPALTVELARRRALELRRQVDLGEDPADTKRQAAKEMTIEKLCERYLAEHAVKKRSGHQDVRRVERFVLKSWRHRRVKDITRADVDQLVSPVAIRTPYEAAHLLALVRKMFSFALDKGIVDVHPCLRMRSPAPNKPRRRVLATARELAIFSRMTQGGVWRRIATESESDCLRFIALTGCRSSEAAELPWSEIDLEQRVWTLSAERSKNKRDHLVPLTDDVMDILRRRKNVPGTYVFPGTTAEHLYASRLCVVCKRLCRRVARIGFAMFTPHDLRRTVETGMAAARVHREYRDRVLNHVDSSVGAVHYNLYDYLDEKRAALEAWARRLRELTSQKVAEIRLLKQAA
jgi:integrase